MQRQRDPQDLPVEVERRLIPLGQVEVEEGILEMESAMEMPPAVSATHLQMELLAGMRDFPILPKGDSVVEAE